MKIVENYNAFMDLLKRLINTDKDSKVGQHIFTIIAMGAAYMAIVCYNANVQEAQREYQEACKAFDESKRPIGFRS